jgi:hypothetical protein
VLLADAEALEHRFYHVVYVPGHGPTIPIQSRDLSTVAEVVCLKNMRTTADPGGLTLPPRSLFGRLLLDCLLFAALLFATFFLGVGFFAASFLAAACAAALAAFSFFSASVKP